MPDSLPALEAQRLALLLQISRLGDFRPGSITPTRGRCGNPNCHCHQPDDPGHGPNDRLTFKRKGKTITETFPTALAQRKAQREIEEFRRFQQLTRALLEVNEKICRLRPVPEAPTSEQEKKRPKPSRKKSPAR
jgi:Family of unknown function (DUF6788)